MELVSYLFPPSKLFKSIADWVWTFFFGLLFKTLYELNNIGIKKKKQLYKIDGGFLNEKEIAELKLNVH
jgi:hypothetical protein